MKAIIYLFSFVLLTAMMPKNERISGDPIAGAAIKITCKSTPCQELSGVTNANGNVEFRGATIGKKIAKPSNNAEINSFQGK